MIRGSSQLLYPSFVSEGPDGTNRRAIREFKPSVN